MGLEHGALRGRLHFTASVMGIKSVVGIFRLYYSFRVDGGERRILGMVRKFNSMDGC
jgi:hypothetical protein